MPGPYIPGTPVVALMVYGDGRTVMIDVTKRPLSGLLWGPAVANRRTRNAVVDYPWFAEETGITFTSPDGTGTPANAAYPDPATGLPVARGRGVRGPCVPDEPVVVLLVYADGRTMMFDIAKRTDISGFMWDPAVANRRTDGEVTDVPWQEVEPGITFTSPDGLATRGTTCPIDPETGDPICKG